MPRMNILNDSSKESFSKPPLFSGDQRKHFMQGSAQLFKRCNKLRSAEARIYLFVGIAYFKATKKLFNFSDFHKADIKTACKRLDIDFPAQSAPKLSKTSLSRLSKMILDLCGYSRFDATAEAFLQPEIDAMVKAELKPKLIFYRCLDLLISKKVALPGYDKLSKIILAALNQRKSSLVQIIDENLSQKSRQVLDSLFEKHESETISDDRYARHKLTLLKKLNQSSKPAKIRERVQDLKYLQELLVSIQDVLPKLGLCPAGFRYYANSVIKSDIFHLLRRNEPDRYLHLIAFIVHQLYRLHDNLIDTLLSVVASFKNSSQREYKEWCFENRTSHNKAISGILQNLDESVFDVLNKIREVLDSKDGDAQKLVVIQELITSGSDYKKRHEQFKHEIQQGDEKEAYLKIMESRSARLSQRITPILKAISFTSESSASKTLLALQKFQEGEGSISKESPCEFLNEEEREFILNKDGKFNTKLYRVYLGLRAVEDLKSGTLNVSHSYKYRSIDDYIISKERWERERQNLLKRADLSRFENCSLILDELEDSLEQSYKKVNNRYLNSENPYLKIRKNGLQIMTPKQEEVTENDQLRNFLPDEPISLIEILATVNNHTGYLQELSHWQQRYSKNTADTKTLIAGLMGKGCAIGTPKIARIAPLINEGTLTNVMNWYFSLDNLQAANDRIIQVLDQMELPKLYQKNPGVIHTASDGQKFTARVDSLNSNYSFKYFGKDQGVSAYTFIDERNLLWYSTVFSASERESAYVIDGLMRNDVVKSDIHSTDSHGYSETVFAVTHLLGFSYAPRIKNLKKQVLYCGKDGHGNIQNDWKIRPSKRFNRSFILENWDDILRLVCTIKLKESNASSIFRRLNSYSKQHRLYKGLKAFGQIIKTSFILRYIDDVNLRQEIEKLLNKVELSNRFTRAVSVGDPRGFSQAEKQEQEIAETANRLIKNAIIFWNYLFLANKLEKLKKHPGQKEALLNLIRTHSVVSWGHINLLGEYDFSDENLQDSFNLKLPKIGGKKKEFSGVVKTGAVSDLVGKTH